MDSSGLMVKQAESLRALNPYSKFFVYRNLVKASCRSMTVLYCRFVFHELR
eukprot:COSAG02_NODE_8987_length_2372_cov_1.285526_2_plen_51_part_00